MQTISHHEKLGTKLGQSTVNLKKISVSQVTYPFRQVLIGIIYTFCKLTIQMMSLKEVSSIVELFHSPSQVAKKNVKKLVEESFSVLGLTESLTLFKEWQKLSTKMCNPTQLHSLSDKKHRLLIIYFVKHEAVDLYNNSYFNHAKIPDDYIEFIKNMGPYLFAEIITIVSRLRLISKHFQRRYNQGKFSQNHIDIKIMKILAMCNTNQRKGNKNVDKFQAIVQVQDQRNELLKELGKMLRNAWALEKKQKLEKRQNIRRKISKTLDSRDLHQEHHKEMQIPESFFNESDELCLCKCGKE